MQLYLSIREIASAFMVMFAIIDITGSTPVILDLQAKGKKITESVNSPKMVLITARYEKFLPSDESFILLIT